MRKKLLSVMATLAVCLSVSFVQAQTWVGEELTSGDFYLYNEGSGKFLAAGNSWGTQASFGDVGILIAASGSENIYTLSTAASYSGKFLGSNGFVDSSTFGWTFTNVGSAGEYIYTIANGENLIGYDGSTSVMAINLTDAESSNAKWLLVSKSQRIGALENATPTNGLDASFFIANPNFDRSAITGWQGAPTSGGSNDNFNGEKFNASFDVYQTLSGLPNGKYEVSCQGFYRAGGYAAAAVSHTEGTEALNAFLYAGSVTTPLMSIFEEADNSGTTGVNTDLGYIPNSQGHTSTYFSAGLYSGNKVNVTVIDGTLRLGIKKDVTISDDWTIFDAFRLTYYGFDNDIAIEALETLISTAEAITGYMSTAASTELAAAISEAETAKSGTKAEIESATSRLTTAISAANASIDAYAAFKTLIDDAETILAQSKADAIDYAEYNAAITAANGTYDAATADNASVLIAATNLENAIVDFVTSNATTDVTGLIINPNFEENQGDRQQTIPGWTKTGGSATEFATRNDAGPAGFKIGNVYVQDWSPSNIDFSVSQNITLPNGIYLLKVAAGGNEGTRGTYVYAGNREVEVTETKDYSVATAVSDGTLTIGFKSISRTVNWAYADNFRLYYYGEEATPILGVSESNLFFTESNVSKTITITATNLTDNLDLSVQGSMVGISFSEQAISASDEALETGKDIIVTFSPEAGTTASDTILITSGDAIKKIAVITSKEENFTPKSSTGVNLITDPTLTDENAFAGWGNNSIVSIATGEQPYSGASCGKINGVANCYPNGGSLDAKLISALDANTEYVMYAMVKTMDGDFNLGISNEASGLTGVNFLIEHTNGVWEQKEFVFTTGAAPTATKNIAFFNNCGTVEGSESAGLIAYIDNWELYKKSDIPVSVENTTVSDFQVRGITNAVIVTSEIAQTINIYAITGQLVKQVDITANETIIPLAKGVYVVNGKKAIVK